VQKYKKYRRDESNPVNFLSLQNRYLNIMEDKKQTVVSASMIYGLLVAVAVIIFSLIIFLLDTDSKSPLNYLSYVFIVAGVIYAQVNYRNKQLSGYITYGKAFMVGLMTMVFAAILVAIYTYINVTVIDPGIVEEARQIGEERMIKQGMTDLQIDQTFAMTGWMFSPAWMTFMVVAANIFVGAIISLITAIFIKKEDQTTMPAA
jgi:hypothetical protein